MKNYQIQIPKSDNTGLDHLNSIESLEPPRELFPPELNAPTALILGGIIKIGHADGSWQRCPWKFSSVLFRHLKTRGFDLD